MGNKGDNSQPPQRVQPQQILESGESAGIGSAERETEVAVRIRLIKLNLQLLSQVRVNENVSLVWETDGYSCYYKGDTLGKVQRSRESQLAPPTSHPAFIYEVADFPPSVIIELY